MKRTRYCCPQMKAALTRGHSWARQICEDENGDLTIFTYAEDQGGAGSREENVKIDFCPFCGKRITHENNDESDPKSYCPDCSVVLCWKEKDGYHAVGSSVSRTLFKCNRKQRKKRTKR